MKIFILLFSLFAFFNFLPSVLRGQCFTTVDAGPDQTICEPGGLVQLQGSINGPSDFVEWTPTDGLTNPNSLTTTASVFSTISYVLSSYWLSTNNLIVNGDFEAGNQSFSSDYAHSPTDLVPEGTYAVLPDPSAAHFNFPPCADHTFMDGTGNMMAVNGSGNAGENVWCQTVQITPGTYYNFSAWVMTIVSNSPAQLQFSVNGEPLGSIYTAPSTPCQWTNFNEDWFSGGNSSATICIVNQNTATGGNDFALDDIAFFEYCQASDTVTIEVLPNSITDVQEFVCVGECYDIGPQSFCSTGFYSQTISSANGCDSTVNLDLTVLNPFAIVQEPDPLTCYNNFITTLDASFSSSTPYTSYFWTGPNGFTSVFQNPVVTEPGTYTLTVTEAAGGVSCTATASVTVDFFGDFPLAIAELPESISCASPVVDLDGSNSSFGNEITYNWSGPGGLSADTSVASTSQEGVYTLTVTNTQSGCTATDVVLVEADLDTPVVSAFSDTITCAQPEANLSAVTDSLAIGFLWSGPQGFTDTVLNSQAPFPGEYTLEVIGSNGCPGSDTILVTADSTLPEFSLTGGLLSCLIQSDTIGFLQGQGVDTFWWSGPGGFSSTEPMPQVTSPGWYAASAAGQNGCILTDSIEVEADTMWPVLTTQGGILGCQNAGVSISAFSPDTVLSWEWTGTGGFSANGQTVLVSQSGTYTVTATSPNGCTNSAQTQVTPSSDLPDLTASGGVLTCAEPAVTLTAQSQAGVSVLWSGPGGFASPLWDVDVSSPGAYTALVIGANGCERDTTVEVGIDTTSPQVQLFGGVLTCKQPLLVLDPEVDTDSVTFSWSNSGGFFSADTSIGVNVADDYTVIVTAQNGCTDSETVTVSQDTTHPTAQLSADVLTCDVQQVAVDANIVASQPTLIWSGPDGFTSADQNPVVSLSGLYTLDILDSLNGCESTFSIEVLADTLPPVIAASGDTLTCASPVGLVQSSVTPDPAVWSWSGPNGFVASGSAASVDEAGEYMVLAIGENGCADSLSVSVSIDTIAPDLDVSGPAASCAVPNPVWQAISIQSETYEWGGAGGFTAVGASTPLPAPGVYKLSGTAANGCLTELTFEVPADTTAPVVSAQGGEISCDSGVLTLTGTTDSVQSPILWSGPGGFFSSALSPEVSLPGIYELTVTAANGCQGIDTALVMADEDIPDLTLSGDTITCLEPVAQLIGASATAGVTFAWVGPDGFQSSESEPDAAIPGPYTLTVTAPNGCSATAQTTVAIDTASPVITTLGVVLTCFEPEQPLPATLIEPADATLAWSGPDGFVSDQLQPVVTSGGQYVLTATAENGCSSTALADVGVDTVSPEVVLSTTGILTCAEPVQDVIAADPGVGMLFVEWLDQGGVLVSNELSFEATAGGTYLCRMTNMENGCASEASIELVEDFMPATAVITAENGGVLTCDFPSIVLSGEQSTPSGAIGYLWQSPSGLPAGSQAELLASEGGAYQLVVEHLSSGCRDTAVTQVSVDQEIPVVTVAPPGILTCAQTELRLDAAGSSAGVEFVYAWEAQPGLILEGAMGAEPLVGQAGTYQLHITDSSNGCADSVSVSVTADTVPPVAVATALGELNCVTDAVTLTASGSSTGPDISLLWTTLSGGILSGDLSSAEVEALSAGLYLLQVERTSNGCTANDTVVVTENTSVPSSIATDVEPPYCPGGRGRLTITSVLGGTPPYLYSLNGQAFSPQVAYDNLAPGTYTVVVQDVIGCEAAVTVTIDEPASPQIFLPDAINMRFSETRQLLPDLNFPESLIDSLIWSPGDFLSCADCLRPFVELPRHTITYRLTIVTAEGCSADAEILVRVNRLRSVYVPNAFSPGNQDGFNDELTVYGPIDEVRRINRFAIFDRWGEQVFEARDFAPNDPTVGWNGQHRGQMMDPGVFVYLAEVEFVDGEVVIYEGDVTLIR